MRDHTEVANGTAPLAPRIQNPAGDAQSSADHEVACRTTREEVTRR